MNTNTRTYTPHQQLLIRLIMIAKMAQRISDETIANLNKPTPMFTYNGTSVQHVVWEKFDLLIKMGMSLDLQPTDEEIEMLDKQLAGEPVTMELASRPNDVAEAYLQTHQTYIQFMVNPAGFGGAFMAAVNPDPAKVMKILDDGTTPENLRKIGELAIKGYGSSMDDALADLMSKVSQHQ